MYVPFQVHQNILWGDDIKRRSTTEPPEAVCANRNAPY